MKKLFSILVLFCSAVASLPKQSSAQSTTPRFGITKNRDNTYQALSLSYADLKDTAATAKDTVFISPSGYENVYKFTLTDSAVICLKSLKSCYFGDKLYLSVYVPSGSGRILYFTGTSRYFSGTTKWATSSTGNSVSPASGKRVLISFIFDGATWSEFSRSVQ